LPPKNQISAENVLVLKYSTRSLEYFITNAAKIDRMPREDKVHLLLLSNLDSVTVHFYSKFIQNGCWVGLRLEIGHF
jgi:hypothetical protein